MGHEHCKSVAQKIRKAYPNATHGLEFCYYYTGDDWSGMSNTKATDAFSALPKYGAFLFTDQTPEPDEANKRTPLPRTVPRARLNEEVKQSVQNTMKDTQPLLNCVCGWSGDLAGASAYDAEIPSCIDWTCPDCARENTRISGGISLPINAEK